MTQAASIIEKINLGHGSVGVIGMGYVGLPLAMSFCAVGLNVIGFDIDPEKVKKLNNAEPYLDSVSRETLHQYFSDGLFVATDDFSQIENIDVIIICVPTPLLENHEPDLSYVVKTCEVIKKYLKSGHLIVLESTTYPGTVDEILRPIFSSSNLIENEDYYLAFSPEREDPGNKNFHTTNIPKVLGADSQDAFAIAEALYSKAISGGVVGVSSCKTAEAVKITENVFRAVNIALVNELKIIYEAMGIDVWEVVDAAATKPFGYMPFYPGPGLGGHCIPIDPFYLSWKAKQHNQDAHFIELAGQINRAMPEYVVNKLKLELELEGIRLSDAKVLVIGVAYKKNVDDLRESPAFSIMRLLQNLEIAFEYHDPHVETITTLRDYPELVGLKSVDLSVDKISSFDATLIVTNHDNIDYQTLAQHSRLIVDTRNAMDAFESSVARVVKA